MRRFGPLVVVLLVLLALGVRSHEREREEDLRSQVELAQHRESMADADLDALRTDAEHDALVADRTIERLTDQVEACARLEDAADAYADWSIDYQDFVARVLAWDNQLLPDPDEGDALVAEGEDLGDRGPPLLGALTAATC